MGLFTKKDPCAICGGKVSGLFPWKIGGHLVCNECHGQVDLPNGLENSMTLEDFQAYRQFREENSQLKVQFQISEQMDFGWLDTKFLFDYSNRLLCMDKNLNTTIFAGQQVKSFIIREDTVPIFEGSAAGLQRSPSAVPDRVFAMTPQIDRIRMQREMERMRDRMDGERDSRPYVDLPEPFRNFNIEIYFDHPYWNVFTADMSGPTFNNNSPSVDDYMREYGERFQTMERLAVALMEVAFPGGAQQPVQEAVINAAGQVDAVTEIQRFKALLDQGIITEEEFTAKKRQLLGI